VATIAEVPTFKELGYDIVVSESVVLFGPKELPEDIVQILATAFNAAIKTESFKKFAADNQLIIDWQDGARIYQILSDEYQFLGDLAIRIKARS
jgi:tripartite-type tricarboxylate transporter receptor subunit TctC